jgi:hypothetical protein
LISSLQGFLDFEPFWGRVVEGKGRGFHAL